MVLLYQIQYIFKKLIQYLLYYFFLYSFYLPIMSMFLKITFKRWESDNNFEDNDINQKN
jgi:hypothetical protein